MSKLYNPILIVFGVIVLCVFLYDVGFYFGKKEEMNKWKSQVELLTEKQNILTAQLNKRINELENEVLNYNKELDDLRELNNENIKEIENDNKDNSSCIINGNLNRLHDNFTKTSN